VPNRYKINAWSMLTQPKSIATVVVVFCGTAQVSSTPTLGAVITSSVRSGGISETAPTKVVLPTPNPPATTIFAEVTRPAPVVARAVSSAGDTWLVAVSDGVMPAEAGGGPA
jgi:hypothetical protein